MSSLQWGAGIFPVSPFFIKVDTAIVSMYNKRLEIMPMEFILCLVGVAGVMVGVFESIRGDIKR